MSKMSPGILATSREVFSPQECHRSARKCAESYRTEVARYAAMRFLDVWYSRIDVEHISARYDAIQPKRAVRRRQHDIQKATRRTSLAALTKLCEQADGEYRIKPDYPVIVRYPVDQDPGIAGHDWNLAVLTSKNSLTQAASLVPGGLVTAIYRPVR